MPTKLLLLSLLTATPVFACEPMAGELKLHSPAKADYKNPVSVDFELRGSNLHVAFEVRVPEKNINGKKKFVEGDFPYKFDAVEVFLSVGGENNYPYYEYELTPFNQIYQVKLPAPKQFPPGVDLGMTHSPVKVEKDKWTAEMVIPLEPLGWDGDPAKIVGNVYAILGKKPGRSYWALSLPNQAKPDFHQPKKFQPFFRCEREEIAPAPEAPPAP